MSGPAVTGPLVAAIEAAWHSIRETHGDVPEVVVTLGSGSEGRAMKLGHFAPDRWMRPSDAADAVDAAAAAAAETMHELFVGGEGLSRGGVGVLGTLLHEAAHGAAVTRGIQDTSRQGRFHNAKFRAIGEEFGLELSHDRSIGWSVTAVPASTAARYAAEVAQLDAALVAYRVPELNGGGRKSNNNGVVAVCDCGRRLRVSRKVYDEGPILCGNCGEAFTAEEADDEDED